MSYRSYYDSWPWKGTREEARRDAERKHPNHDLNDRYGSEQQQVYHESYERERRRIDDRHEENRRTEEVESRRIARRNRELREEEEAEINKEVPE